MAISKASDPLVGWTRPAIARPSRAQCPSRIRPGDHSRHPQHPLSVDTDLNPLMQEDSSGVREREEVKSTREGQRGSLPPAHSVPFLAAATTGAVQAHLLITATQASDTHHQPGDRGQHRGADCPLRSSALSTTRRSGRSTPRSRPRTCHPARLLAALTSDANGRQPAALRPISQYFTRICGPDRPGAPERAAAVHRTTHLDARPRSF